MLKQSQTLEDIKDSKGIINEQDFTLIIQEIQEYIDNNLVERSIFDLTFEDEDF